jgi:REP element-mobilizing transposase RayT
MALPRSRYVREGQEGVYHCFSRCVRRAFLYGFDALTRRDFSHRKKWLVNRLRDLAAIFAVEVCAYAIMENHYHTILRTRPDIAAGWSDREVAIRWLTLFPKSGANSSAGLLEDQIRGLATSPERIAKLRLRLCSLSWFMGRLNEFVARAANKEDRVKGRFWEARFKCQALLDQAAITACMVYVDLNPIRAGIAATPEESEFTSIQQRIRSWHNEQTAMSSTTAEIDAICLHGSKLTPEIESESSDLSEPISDTSNSLDDVTPSSCWLCPISPGLQNRGILQMSLAEYLDLVDRSGRMIRCDKRGAIDVNLAPILLRIGANPAAWSETVSRFGSQFNLAAGLLSNMRHFADELGKRWLKGSGIARIAFAV